MRSGTGTLIVNVDSKNKCDAPYTRIKQALETGVDVVLVYQNTYWFYDKTFIEEDDGSGEGIMVRGIAFSGIFWDVGCFEAAPMTVVIWENDNATRM